MAGMALLLICTVAADEGGWRSGQATATGPVVNQAVPTVSVAENPLTGLPQGPPTTNPVTADWSDIQNALMSPPGKPSRSHAGFPSLRSADGIDVPPEPPAIGLTNSGRFPGTAGGRNPAVQNPLAQGLVTPDPVAQGPIQGLGEPPPLIPSGRPPSGGVGGQSRVPGREVVYENNFQQGSFSDRKYISAPPRDSGAVVPVRNGDPHPGVDRDAQSHPLPDIDDNPAGRPAPSNQDGTNESTNETTEAKSEQWWPLLLTMIGLFASLGFNIYLGWIAFDIHGRYNEIADEIQELEQKLEESGGRTEATDRRRESRRHLAG